MTARITGFDRDHRWCERLDERHHRLAPRLLARNRHFGGIYPVKLEIVPTAVPSG
jgi:hypothetical protein